MQMNQAKAGLLLISSGVGLQFFGLCWASQIHSAPFQRLALTAHSNALSNGTPLALIYLPSDIIPGVMILGTGLLFRQTDIIQLSSLQSAIVVAGLSTAWLSVISGCANSYWYVLLRDYPILPFPPPSPPTHAEVRH